MTIARAGIFEINYTLRTNTAPGEDIQFGMDFTLTQTTAPLPLTQLIFPATAVGANRPGEWNVDNRQAPSTNPDCLIFANAGNGTIRDIPTELSRRNRGVLTTKFAVYRVDISKNTVQTSGVTFGYTINTNDQNPATAFTAFSTITLPNDQKQKILAKCSTVKFS